MKIIYLIVLSLFFTSAVNCAIGNQWKKVAGIMSQVYATSEFLWGINAYRKIHYCVRPCTGNWIGAGDGYTNADIEGIYIWGINVNSYSYHKVKDSTGSWSAHGEIRNMVDVAVGNDLYVWFLNNNKEIFRFRHINAAIQKYPGKFDQIDAEAEYIYALNASTHTIYVRPVTGKGDWRPIPGNKMKYVSTGIHDLFAIGIDDNLYRCTIPCAGMWESIGSPEADVVQIDASSDALIAVTGGGVIYYHEIPLQY